MTSYNHNGGPPLADEDMDKNGWIALNRGIRNHWLVGFYHKVKPADPEKGHACHFVAFVDLIMECRYREGYVMNGGRKMKIEPGQLVGAVSWLAARWNWTPKKVRWFLEKLQEDGMITRFSVGNDGILNETQRGNEGGKHAALISLCNYSKYHPWTISRGQAIGQAGGKDGASEGPQGIEETREQGNKIGNAQADLLPDEVSDIGSTTKKRRKLVLDENDPVNMAFDEFWKHYPAGKRKTDRPKARVLFRQIVTVGKDGVHATTDAVIAGIKRYADTKPDPEYVPMPTTWLNGARWEAHGTIAKTETGWWKDRQRVAAITDERWRDGIAKYANGMWPPDKLGPSPGRHDCVVPRQLIDELQLEEKYTPAGIKRPQYHG